MRTRNPEATRANLIAAATQVFARRGFGRAALSEVAIQAGLGKATIYEYWRSKDELLLDCCLEVARTNQAAVTALLGARAGDAAPTDPAQALERMLATCFALVPAAVQHHLPLFLDLWLLARESRRFLAKTRQAWGDVRSQWQNAVRQLVADGIRGGIFRDEPHAVDDVLALVVAVIDGLAFERGVVSELDAAGAERLARLLVRGLRVPT
jgi:AcrR family transcriptional regulator